MGLKSIFDLKCYLNFGVKCSGIISISVIIASCISDGPNHTGGELLTGNGILLDNPYYHVKLPVFPVDSIWTQDEEPSHLGESVLMAGISGPFKAQVRLAFDIADTTLLDSLNDSLSSALRLSVCATQNTSLGRLALFQSVGDSLSKPDTGKADTTSFKDSLAFEVKTWAIPDRDSAGLAIMTSPQRTDTLNLYNHRFLGRMDPDSLLPLHTVLDTIQLKIRSAYNLDQFQNKNIPHLLKFLKANSLSTKWLIQMQLTPIVDSVNSQLAMLRLNGTATSIYGPGLIFGSSSEPKSATKKQKVSPLTFSNSFGVNYTLEYSGSKLAMIPSKARGLHLILNRARLLDSVNAALIRMHINPPVANKSGLFDLTYFVPFAEISLPLDSTTTLEGGYPLDLKVQSDLDSILPDVPVGTFTVKTTKIGGKTLLFYTMENEASDKIRDTVFALYRDKIGRDPNLRQVIIKYSKDTTFNDTQYVQVGQSKTINTRLPPGVLTLFAATDSLQTNFYLSSTTKIEPNNFRDPVTGKLDTTLSQRLPHLLKKNSTSITFRATHGIQSLFNRDDAGHSVFPTLVLSPNGAVDTTYQSNGIVSSEKIPYPLLSIIPPKLVAGKLLVGLDLFLFPIKKER